MKQSSKFVRHIACDECGSTDGNSLYSDNHQFCHVCHTHKAGDNDYSEVTKPIKATKMQLKGTHQSILDRNLSKATSEFFGVTVDGDKQYYSYSDASGAVVAAKVRNVTDKQFSVQGDWKDAVLFGQQKFNKDGKYITICEGELDAMSVFQMTGSKYASVSIKNGAQSALKDCKANYEYLNSFDTIVIAFDADEPGKKAAGEVAELFGSKAKVFKAQHGHKDASDYLQHDDGAKFIKDWWASETWTPDGIIAGSTLWEEVNRPSEKPIALYPWQGVNELTYGLREAELVTVCAGSGLGKSQFLREILWHLVKTTGVNIGCMFMEESVRKTALSIMSLALDKPLHVPDTVVSEEERQKAFDVTMGTERLFFWDNFGSTEIDNVLNRIRYLAKACDCKFIFLDHLSIIFSGGGGGDNERVLIDNLMTKLRTLVQETGVCLIAVSHLKRPDSRGHEDGAATSLSQLRGSASIAQLSDMVIGLQRNSQASDETERNTTTVSILKNRPFGLTSPNCAALLYNRDTGRMKEVDQDAL